MIIIYGTPRSGTSFYAQWYANQYVDHVYHMPEVLGEYFHPDFMNGDETLARINTLTDKSIFKLHSGKEMSSHIWEYISDKKVVIIKRRDVFGQFLSYGIGYTTNKWVSFNKPGLNGLVDDKKIYYKKEWFDELAQRLIEFEDRDVTVAQTHYYEDINTMTANGKLPFKQNIGNKIEIFENKDEIIDWYNDFNTRTGLGNRRPT